MGKIVKHNQPCPDQVKCQSSDGLQIYEDGGGFCFKCAEFFRKEQINDDGETVVATPRINRPANMPAKITLEEIHELPMRGFQERDIPKTICEFFGVRVSYAPDKSIDRHFYPYGTGFNVRTVSNKTFYRAGTYSKLFGQDKFAPGGKRIIVTEGEIDAMSVATAYKRKSDRIWPVVTMGSAVNIKLLIEHREYLRSFDEVILFFDTDEKGEIAKQEAIRAIGLDKVKIANNKTDHKDANSLLIAEGGDAVLRCIYDAYKVIPSGIITRSELKQRMRNLLTMKALPYPPCMEGINSKIKGMRLGEITLFTSGTGSGKSTLLREIILHIRQNTDERIGIVALEESPEAEAKRLSGMFINKNTANEDFSEEEIDVAFDELFGADDEEERITMLDHQGSISDMSIVDKIEYMCLMGCKYILIDHITILVSEGIDNLTGNEAQDKVMNALLSLVKRYPVWIGLVSHLRKTGPGGKSFEEGKLPSLDDIKGSGSIKQISFDIIAFARNMNAKEENKRNTIKMAVLKARTCGLTGPCVGAVYNQETGRLQVASPDSLDDAEEDFEEVEMSVWNKK